MSNLPDILTEALARIEPQTEARMSTLIAEFGAVPMPSEDRLSALAGVIAAIAHARYIRHRGVFLEALRGWSLEIAGTVDLSSLLPDSDGEWGRIRDAQEVLIGGIDLLLRAMVDSGTSAQHRLVAELAVLARLLGRHAPATIHLVITTVGRALADPTWRAGERVRVAMREQTEFLTRDAALERIAPRGTA
jgi:hypothetical protein